MFINDDEQLETAEKATRGFNPVSYNNPSVWMRSWYQDRDKAVWSLSFWFVVGQISSCFFHEKAPVNHNSDKQTLTGSEQK